MPRRCRTEDTDLSLEADEAGTAAGMPSTAQLFDLLWNNLADLMGTAAVATLVRRALGRAAVRRPDLSSVSVIKEELEYIYQLPDSWAQDCDGEAGRALRELLTELGTLLVQLTGPVAVRRLERIAPLKEYNILTSEEVSAWLRRK